MDGCAHFLCHSFYPDHGIRFKPNCVFIFIPGILFGPQVPKLCLYLNSLIPQTGLSRSEPTIYFEFPVCHDLEIEMLGSSPKVGGLRSDKVLEWVQYCLIVSTVMSKLSLLYMCVAGWQGSLFMQVTV